MKYLKLLIFIFIISLGELAGALTVAQNQDSALSLMSYLSSQVVGRPLSKAEVQALQNQGTRAIEPMIKAWTQTPSFYDSAQNYTELLLRANGSADSVNYDLPGFLGKDIARRQRPYSELVTAQECVDATGKAIACDSGAPFAAGVLSTRAFLILNKGAYNIARAAKMMARFVCTTYPLAESEEPRLASSDLIPEFAATKGEVSFGNGNNCYSCHSQFGKHTQFFVKFDLFGRYQSSATGLRKQGNTDGFSDNFLLTSHFISPVKASNEAGTILGRPASNLREAGETLASSPRFLPCAVQNLMKHYLRLSDLELKTVKPDLLKEIADNAKKLSRDPSFSHLVQAIVTHPQIISSFEKSGARP